MYLYETHTHSSNGSACSGCTAVELVRGYKEAGYAGMILTDHFTHGNTSVPRELSWGERMKMYYDAYLQAKEEGEKLDFDVFFGIEQTYGNGKEVLIYGIDLEFLMNHPELDTATIEEYANIIHEHGGILVHAHPYRSREYIIPNVVPRYDVCDGIEVYNMTNEIGVIAFNIKNVHPHDASTIFDEANICLRAGHHCAQLLTKWLGVNGTLRGSFYIYNDYKDVDKMIKDLMSYQCDVELTFDENFTSDKIGEIIEIAHKNVETNLENYTLNNPGEYLVLKGAKIIEAGYLDKSIKNPSSCQIEEVNIRIYMEKDYLLSYMVVSINKVKKTG